MKNPFYVSNLVYILHRLKYFPLTGPFLHFNLENYVLTFFFPFHATSTRSTFSNLSLSLSAWLRIHKSSTSHFCMSHLSRSRVLVIKEIGFLSSFLVYKKTRSASISQKPSWKKKLWILRPYTNISKSYKNLFSNLCCEKPKKREKHKIFEISTLLIFIYFFHFVLVFSL